MFSPRTGLLLPVLAFLVVVAGPTGRDSLRAAGGSQPKRADANHDGAVDISDASYLLNFLFLGGPAFDCLHEADANGDGSVDISDASFLLNFLFLGGPLPGPLTSAEIVACGGQLDLEVIARGEQVYMAPSDRKFNAFSCSSCHAAVPDAESGFLFSASSLHDAIRRPNYKLGKFDDFIDAANTCRVHWMETTAWTGDDNDFKDLVVYLESIAPAGPAPAVVYTISRSTTTGPATGDAATGCEFFHRTCVACHGEGAAGTPDLGPSLIDFVLEPDFIRERVRLSGSTGSVYEGLLGDSIMPFWSIERLSDTDLENVVTYLTGRPLAECPSE